MKLVSFLQILKYLDEMLSSFNSCSSWWSQQTRASMGKCPLDLLVSSFTCHIVLLKTSGKNIPQNDFHERLMKASFRSALSLLYEVFCYLSGLGVATIYFQAHPFLKQNSNHLNHSIFKTLVLTRIFQSVRVFKSPQVARSRRKYY